MGKSPIKEGELFGDASGIILESNNHMPAFRRRWPEGTMSKIGSRIISICFFLISLAPIGSFAQEVMGIYNPSGIRPDGVYVDQLLKRTMTERGKIKPPLAADFPGGKMEKVLIRKDVYGEVNDLFYKRGWTDGLPIVPPTVERVQEMLRGADLSGDYLVSVLDPMGGQATVEKIAVNAVMAGCRPAYMPVLMAAVEAIANPGFDLRGIATTTSPDIPMLIVSGPVARQLGINSGTNALGRGWRANATISRALHLIMQNIGGSWPDVTDMSTLGQPGEISMMVAENEKANPWAPLHMDLGFPEVANVVTVLAAEGTHNVYGIGRSSEGFLKMIADYLAGMDRAYRSTLLLVIAQDTAQMLARDGWTREKIRQFIKENARLPFFKYKERFLDPGMARIPGGVPNWILQTKDPQALIPSPMIDQLLILVSGGPGEKSLLVPGWIYGKAVSKEIRLPANWKELLNGASE
jgi:hypothetical protein